jgi:hypothetical protein
VAGPVRAIFRQYPVVLSVIGGAITAGSVWVADHSHDWLIILPLTLVAGIGVALPAALLHQNKLMQTRSEAQDVMRHALELLVFLLAKRGRDKAIHMRACVMLCLTSGGRRQVQKRTAMNMTHDPDCDLEIAFSDGVSGAAASRSEPVFGDLRLQPVPGGPSWKLPNPSEQAKVRLGLQTIWSVPILGKEHSPPEVIGTLQVDSDHGWEDIVAQPADFFPVLESFAKMLAPILLTEEV